MKLMKWFLRDKAEGMYLKVHILKTKFSISKNTTNDFISSLKSRGG